MGRPYVDVVAEPQLQLTADLFATAEAAKAALLVGEVEAARRAGDVLLSVLAANKAHMQAGKFYMRWPCGQTAGTAGELAGDGLAREDSVFHCVSQAAPGQLYFLVAFPVMALVELSEVTGVAEYRTAAIAMLDFLKGCQGVFESPWSHKVARAAAMAGDAATARRLADYFVQQQQPAGCYQEDTEAMDAVDQTAEIAVWLYQIQQDLDKLPPDQS